MRSSFTVHFIYRNYEFVVWGKIMKKVIFILIFISTITGCYSAKDDCYYGMTTICFGKPYSPIAKFQKPYSFGHTDSVKRMDDLVSCGLRKGDLSMRSAWAMDHLPKADPHLQQKNWDAFFKCMEIKGYIWVEDCGRKSSTSDKGLCNE